MARRHGWQLPAHGFQIMAITVYSLLSIAFYAFFAPFLGKDLYEYIAAGVYSLFAFSVFILYTRCTAIDPADSGVFIKVDDAEACISQKKYHLEDVNGTPGGHNGSSSNVGGKYPKNNSFCCGLGSFCCACLVKEDCRNDQVSSKKQSDEDDSLFCTLCNAEVNKFSKHCRTCDKCVDGFDHHCRWLNNCVGKKNYHTFLALMTMSLFWLIVEFGVGIAVLVRCFTHKKETDMLITDKLGNIFSRAPFATIVAICTTVSFMACIPVGELFCFHMLLIRKGITTYEYVVAMRSQSEPGDPSIREDISLRSSPFSSALTAISGGSSLGLQYRGAWCTPPRIFVDHQDEIIPHLERDRVPSTTDPDDADAVERGKRQAKRPVRISAWKLAKLDSSEAIKAAAKARASSSVLRPVKSHSQYDTDQCSSDNASDRSSALNSNVGFDRDDRTGIMRSSNQRSPYAPSHGSRDDLETCPQTPSDLSSPYYSASMIRQLQNTAHYNPVYQTSANRSPLSQTDDGDDSSAVDEEQGKDFKKKQNAVATRTSNSSVYWDRAVGHFVTPQTTAGSSSSQIGGPELTYTGQSIFFGGPLLNNANARSSESSQQSTSQRQGGVDRRRGSHQLPLFVPNDKKDYRMP